MERRVRGIFAKQKSAKPAKLLALALCFALGAACFTTACRPATAAITTGDEYRESPISRQTAIQNAADLIEAVYSVTADTDRMYADEYGEDKYTVYMERENEETYDYYAYIDKETGGISQLSKNDDQLTLTREQLETANTYNVLTADESDMLELASDCMPTARELVERVFANGRTVTQTEFGSIMTDVAIEPMQEVAICVRMDEGACYRVLIVWPQMEVISVSVYPLGWHSCFYGYDDPDEADEYPPLED